LDKYNQILDNINTRYVLLRRDTSFSIIDKLRGTMVLIDEEVDDESALDKSYLIEEMILLKVDVYEHPRDLPKPIEKYVGESTNSKK